MSTDPRPPSIVVQAIIWSCLENSPHATSGAFLEALEACPEPCRRGIARTFREPQGTGFVGSFSPFVGDPRSSGMVGSFENKHLDCHCKNPKGRRLACPEVLLRLSKGLAEWCPPGPLVREPQENGLHWLIFILLVWRRKPPCPIGMKIEVGLCPSVETKCGQASGPGASGAARQQPGSPGCPQQLLRRTVRLHKFDIVTETLPPRLNGCLRLAKKALLLGERFSASIGNLELITYSNWPRI